LNTALEAPWRKILDTIRERVGDKRFDLWFMDTSCVEKTTEALTIGVPSQFVANWLRENLLDVIGEAAEQIEGRRLAIKLKVDGELFRSRRMAEQETRSKLIEDGAAKGKKRAFSSQKTLDDFVVGPCNEMAFVACRQVAGQTGSGYNPLFIHGSVGLGKTHLLQGVHRALRARRVACAFISGESFTNQFIYSLRSGNIDAFRRKFRAIDALVIDDVHFLANKASTQEEFLHTFNALSGHRKQVVLSSDTHPRRMPAVSEAIVSRLVSGMVVELKKPDKPTRRAILEAKCAKLGQRIDPALLDYIATNVTASVRELEGALTNVVAYASLAKSRLTVETAREILSSFLNQAGRSLPTLKAVKEAVAEHFSVSVADLTGRKRSRNISMLRQLAMYLCRTIVARSYKDIGLAFDGRDHAAVMAACKKAEKLLAGDPVLRGAVDEIRAVLGAD